MKKVLKYLGLVAFGLLAIGLLLLLTPAITGVVYGSVHSDLKEALNGFVMTFGAKGVLIEAVTPYLKGDVAASGVAITAFVFVILSMLVACFISVNNMLKKPLVKLPFPAFWCGLFVTSLVSGILFFVEQGQLAADYDLGPAFVLAGVMAILVALLSAFRVVLKMLKKD